MEQLDPGGIREPEARQVELNVEVRGDEITAFCVEHWNLRLIELALELQADRSGTFVVSRDSKHGFPCPAQKRRADATAPALPSVGQFVDWVFALSSSASSAVVHTVFAM